MLQRICCNDPMLSFDTPPSRTFPTWLLIVAIMGAAAALFGGFWDDAWHTERGRDSFFIAPHVLIYGGISLVGAALTLRVGRVVLDGGSRALRADPALLLAAVSVAATIASGPIDNAWHIAFGRDAVAWSPPHMLGVVGTLALGAALLTQARHRPVLQVILGGIIIVAGVFAVFEYDTDVPQFSALWYLPAITTGVAVAFELIRLTSESPWARSRAAATHLALMGLVSLFLLITGFRTPGLALLLPAAMAMDIWARRGRGDALSGAVVLAVTLAASYVPVRNWLGHGVSFDAREVILGTTLAIGAAYLVATLAGRTRGSSPAAMAVAAVMALMLVMPMPALAHDPGQGDPAGTASLRATADGRWLTLSGRLSPCRDLRSGRLVARRAGEAITAPLRVAGCRFAGRLRVTQRGRWFLYANLATHAETIETWVPIDADRGRQQLIDSGRFAYEPRREPSGAGKLVLGIVLYAAMLALLIATLRLVARDASAQAERSEQPGSNPSGC